MMSEEELFKIDIDGEDSGDETNNKKPDYYVDHFLTNDIPDEGLIDEEEDNKSSVRKTTETCWNCSKVGHALRDCPLPPNRAKISQAKKSFINNKTQNSKRYHDNKFAKFRPGKISSKLREALGLRRNQVPEFIYKLRVFGYPEGWLMEAKIVNSGIKMYDSKGKRIREPDEEEGEIKNKVMKYDTEKIIEYPGFNVPLERGFKDEHRAYGYPPMRPEHSINNFIKYLEKLSSSIEEMTDNSTDDESLDMDLSDMLPTEIVEESPNTSQSNKRIDDTYVEESPHLCDSKSKSSNSSETLEEGEITSRTNNLPLCDYSLDKSKVCDTDDSIMNDNESSDQLEEGVISSDNHGRKRNLNEESTENKMEDEITKNKRKKSIQQGITEETKGTDNNQEEIKTEKNESKKHENQNLERDNEQVFTEESPCNLQINIDGNQPTQGSSNTLSSNSISTENEDYKSMEKEEVLNIKCSEENIIMEVKSNKSDNFSINNFETNGTSLIGSIKQSVPIEIEKNCSSQSSPSSRLRHPEDSVSSTPSFGTPNIKSHSPYSKLPAFENFNKNISDVIDFENLPDSVGKYESMCTIISKIRSFMSSKSPKNSKGK